MSAALDRLVSKKVMGWTVRESEPDDYERYSSGWAVSRWNPSTCIKAAWEVVEHLRKQRLYLIINDTMGQYRARFFDSHWMIDDWVRAPDIRMTVWAATAPLAICIAALKAFGVPESEIQEAMR